MASTSAKTGSLGTIIITTMIYCSDYVLLWVFSIGAMKMPTSCEWMSVMTSVILNRPAHLAVDRGMDEGKSIISNISLISDSIYSSDSVQVPKVNRCLLWSN